MIVSVELPDELVTKLEEFIEVPKPPVWPFPSKTVVPQGLNSSGLEKLEKYQKEFAEYEKKNRNGTLLRTRSAVVRMIINEYLSRNGNS